MTKVKLRTKAISGRKLSLYLDFYPPIIHPETGLPTRRDFLKLYLFDKPQNPLERDHNKETKMLAQKIWSQRTLELDKGDYGFLQRDNKNVDFIKYFTDLAEKHKQKTGTYDAWKSALNFLESFTNGNCKIGDLNEKFCNDFRDYLLTTKSKRSTKVKLSRNSVVSYFNKFKASLKQAFKDGLLKENLNDKIDFVKAEETQREFLTLEELQALAKSDCDNPLLKRAALFSALTGLRWSDIKKLKWSEVQNSNSQGYYLRYRQEKTEGVETLPVSKQAVELLGEQGAQDEEIFKKLHYSAYFNILLARWMIKAKITKNITFHNFRHTYATLQLSQGTDIYTISKMLGHRNVKTTQVYAKIIDEKKREAADKIKLDIE